MNSIVSLPPGGNPTSASLNGAGLKVGDQGTCQACTGFATQSAMAIKTFAQKLVWEEVSVPHILTIGGQNSFVCVTGTVLDTLFAIHRESGGAYVVKDDVWQFDTNAPEISIDAVPSMSVLDDNGFAWLKDSVGIRPKNLDDIKAAIAQGFPPVLGVPVYIDGFTGWQGDGVIDVPTGFTTYNGEHAVALLSYDDATSRVKFINSWGTNFGNGGYGEFTYEFLKNYSLGGQAITVLSFKNDTCASDYCSANDLNPGNYCNGGGPKSVAVTCGYKGNCVQEVASTVCPEECANGVCVPAVCPSGLPGPALVKIPHDSQGHLCIDATEVTRDQYAAFISATNDGQATGIEDLGQACSWNTSYVPAYSWPPGAQGNHPVKGVDWCDAYAYCKWAGKRLCGNISGGAVPWNQFSDPYTSMWHYACTAGGNKIYPYADTFSSSACNGSSAGVGNTAPVASFPECEGGFPGIFDMSGNLSEWEDGCETATGETDSCRLRGGAFYYAAEPLTCDFNFVGIRRDALEHIGFRCCGI